MVLQIKPGACPVFHASTGRVGPTWLCFTWPLISGHLGSVVLSLAGRAKVREGRVSGGLDLKRLHFNSVMFSDVLVLFHFCFLAKANLKSIFGLRRNREVHSAF